LLKEERAIVSDMPGTTRDTVDAVLKWQKRTFRILDTAGIRRPGRVARAGQVEGVAVVIARRAIEKADVAVLVVDSVEGATDQDATIAGEADKAGAGVIIVANKWDLMKGRGHDYSKEFDDKLRRQVRFLDYAPILHISALTDGGVEPVARRGDRRASAGQPRPARSADHVRRADQRRAADVRVLHERGDVLSLLLRAVPDQPAPRVVRHGGYADPDSGAAPRQEQAVGHGEKLTITSSRDSCPSP
jgi:small GTP-binding protein